MGAWVSGISTGYSPTHLVQEPVYDHLDAVVGTQLLDPVGDEVLGILDQGAAPALSLVVACGSL